MLVRTVQLVSAKDGAFDGGSAEGDAVALGRKCGRGDAELHLVQPEVFVLAVALFGTEADRNGIATVFAGGNDDAILIDGCTSKVGCHRCADVIHTQGEGTALELLDDFRCAVISIERSLGELDGQVSAHCLCQFLRGAVTFVTVLILGDLGIVQHIKTNRSHDYSSNS